MACYTFRNCPADVRNSSESALRVDYQNEGEPWTWTLLFPGEVLPGLAYGRVRTVRVDLDLCVDAAPDFEAYIRDGVT